MTVVANAQTPSNNIYIYIDIYVHPHLHDDDDDNDDGDDADGGDGQFFSHITLTPCEDDVRSAGATRVCIS